MHQQKLEKKETNPQILAENCWFNDRQNTGKQGDTSDCSLMLSNSKALSLGCIATSDLGLYKVCLQVPAHTFTHLQLYSIHPLQYIELPHALSLPAGLQGITVPVFTHRKNWSITAWNLQKYHPHNKKIKYLELSFTSVPLVWMHPNNWYFLLHADIFPKQVVAQRIPMKTKRRIITDMDISRSEQILISLIALYKAQLKC